MPDGKLSADIVPDAHRLLKMILASIQSVQANVMLVIHPRVLELYFHFCSLRSGKKMGPGENNGVFSAFDTYKDFFFVKQFYA